MELNRRLNNVETEIKKISDTSNLYTTDIKVVWESRGKNDFSRISNESFGIDWEEFVGFCKVKLEKLREEKSKIIKEIEGLE